MRFREFVCRIFGHKPKLDPWNYCYCARCNDHLGYGKEEF